MPMGIVSSDDFEVERTRLGLRPNKVSEANSDSRAPEVIDIKKGRGEGKLEVPEVVRETVAKCAINGEGTAKDIADVFGVSPSSVSAYKVGSHSTTSYHRPDEGLLDSITSHKAKISKKARARLISALNNITDEKLENTKAIDLASIAKNMASVVKDMEPPATIINEQQNNVQFVFMAPKVRDENSFRTLVVDE